MTYDVIVSGLGPAGATFLKELSGSGLKVLALEKEEFPRAKPCAGGLTVKAYNLLKELFPGLDSVVRLSTKTLELHYGKAERVITSPYPLTYLTDREELDNYLFNCLPFKEFEVHTGEGVTSVAPEERGLKVKTKKGAYRCRVLVVAEGANSKTAAQFKVKRDMGYTYEADVEAEFEDKIVIDFSHFKWGYYWIFPKGSHVTTGVGEFKSRELFKRLRELLKGFNAKHGVEGKVKWERGFPIPAGRGKNDVYRERLIFLGDSGGLVDPLTGEGIYYGARSGQIGAESVKEAFLKGDLKELSRYKEKIDGELGREFFWARVVGRLFFPLRRLNFKALERSEEIALLAARLLSGEISYREGFFTYGRLLPGALLGF